MAMLAATQVSGSAERFGARGPESGAGERGLARTPHVFHFLGCPSARQAVARAVSSARRSFLKTP